MSSNDIPTLIRQLHAELARAPTLDAESRELLSVLARDLEKAQSQLSTARQFAVRFEADHPGVAAALRQIVETFSKAGV
jgi:hypothetical protein